MRLGKKKYFLRVPSARGGIEAAGIYKGGLSRKHLHITHKRIPNI